MDINDNLLEFIYKWRFVLWGFCFIMLSICAYALISGYNDYIFYMIYDWLKFWE